MICFNRTQEAGSEHVALIVEFKEDGQLDIINRVAFNTEIEFDFIKCLRFDMTVKNFPCFMITTTMSCMALVFSVQGIKVKQIGGEVELEEGSAPITRLRQCGCSSRKRHVDQQ